MNGRRNSFTITINTEETYRITQIRWIEVLCIQQSGPPVSLLVVNGTVQLIPEWTIGNIWHYMQPEQHNDNDCWTQPK